LTRTRVERPRSPHSPGKTMRLLSPGLRKRKEEKRDLHFSPSDQRREFAKSCPAWAWTLNRRRVQNSWFLTILQTEGKGKGGGGRGGGPLFPEVKFQKRNEPAEGVENRKAREKNGGPPRCPLRGGGKEGRGKAILHSLLKKKNSARFAPGIKPFGKRKRERKPL